MRSSLRSLLRLFTGPLVLLLVASDPAHAGADPADACFDSYEQAQRLRNSEKLLAALAKLELCVEDACPEMIRTDCGRWLGEVGRDLPSFVPVATHDGEPVLDVSVSADGELLTERLDGGAIDLDPGVHHLRFEARGYQPVERELRLPIGRKVERVAVELEPIPSDPPDAAGAVPVPALVLGGVGVVGLALFAGFGAKSHAERQDLEACKGSCPEDEVDAVRNKQVVADVSLVVGLAALGGGTALYLRSRRDGEARLQLRIGWLPNGGAGAAVGGSF